MLTSVVASAERCTLPVPREFFVTIVETQRSSGESRSNALAGPIGSIPGMLWFADRRGVETQNFVNLGSAEPPSTSQRSNGCNGVPNAGAVDRAFGLGGDAMNSRSCPGGFVLFAVWLAANPAFGRMIANYATMRIELGPLQPAPHPDGPAQARSVLPGGGGASEGGIENDQMNGAENFEEVRTLAVTYEVKLALDIQSD